MTTSVGRSQQIHSRAITRDWGLTPTVFTWFLIFSSLKSNHTPLLSVSSSLFSLALRNIKDKSLSKEPTVINDQQLSVKRRRRQGEQCVCGGRRRAVVDDDSSTFLNHHSSLFSFYLMILLHLFTHQRHRITHFLFSFLHSQNLLSQSVAAWNHRQTYW